MPHFSEHDIEQIATHLVRQTIKRTIDMIPETGFIGQAGQAIDPNGIPPWSGPGNSSGACGLPGKTLVQE